MGGTQVKYSTDYAYVDILCEAVKNGNLDVVGSILSKYNIVDSIDEKSCTPIYYAITTNNIPMTTLLLERGASINDPLYYSINPLLVAVEQNNPRVSRLLLERGASVDIGHKDGVDVFLASVMRGSVEMARLLMQHGCGAQSTSWGIVLHHAAMGGDIDMIKFLVSKGCALNKTDKRGRTPLHYAAMKNHKSVVEYIITKVDINVIDKHGFTALHYSMSHADLAVFGLLLKNGSSVNISTPVPILHHALILKRPDIVDILLKNGADINQVGEDGENVFDMAVQSGNMDMVKIFIDNKAMMPGNGKYCTSLLKYAIDKEDVGMVLLLLDNGMDINIMDKGGDCALVSAVRSGNAEIVKILLGHEVFIGKVSGRIALFSAVSENDIDMVRLLLAHGAKPRSKRERGSECGILHTSVAKCDYDMTQLLLDYGCDPNSKNMGGETALHVAVRRNHYSLASLLLENGVDVNSKNKYGETALYDAMANAEMIMLLIEHGACINTVDKLGRSPLSIAARYFKKRTVILLVEHGADVNSRSINGETPLSLAVSRHKTKMAKYLLEKGACVDNKTKLGRNPLHVCIKRDFQDITWILLDHNADVNYVDKRTGYTPLYLAAKWYRFNVACILVKKGAKINNGDGIYALRRALEYYNGKDLAKLLLNKGVVVDGSILHSAIKHSTPEIVYMVMQGVADINIPGKGGNTALHYASRYNPDVVQALLNRDADVFAFNKKGKLPLSRTKNSEVVQTLVVNMVLKTYVHGERV